MKKRVVSMLLAGIVTCMALAASGGGNAGSSTSASGGEASVSTGEAVS